MSGHVIDKPPVSTTPPILPPYLRSKREPNRRVIILPDITLIKHQSTVYDHENNWKTTIYQWMNRISGESIFDPSAKWEIAHVHSRQYRLWLETYTPINDHHIPPHISFGGAIRSGNGDPTFYPRWQDWAQKTFC